MIDFFSKLKDNRIFQFSVVVIIILNAILIGATTYQLDPIFLNTIHLLDYAITVFCLLYTSPSPRDMTGSRMPSSA